MAIFRLIVHDVDAAVSFYADALGFALVMQYGPAMAIMERDDLRLLARRPCRLGLAPHA